jgi:membrane associated rhomboid family serine protease
LAIIGICAVLWLVDAFTPRVQNGAAHQLGWWLGLRSDAPWALWTYLTYGFVHAPIDAPSGLWHILGNMLTLFFLGRPVEERYGSREFLRFYLLAIVVAGVAAMIYYRLTGTLAFCVGASGGVSATLILFALNFPRQTILFFGIVPLPAWLLGALIVGMDFFRALSPGSHVAWQAHLAGAAFALAYFKFGWNFQRFDVLRWPARIGRRRPRIRVHDPDHAHEDLGEGSDDFADDKMTAAADEVLAKLHREGEASLTRRERRLLENYSRHLRQRR